jgi:CelD/BcsL family acetyltransferase involved in cellulose biosynthesis
MDSMPDLIQIQVITDIDEAAPLWRALERFDAHYFFQRLDVMQTWFDTIGRREAIAPYFVFVLDAQSTPRMMFPLAVQELTRIPHLVFLDLGMIDYNCPLFDPEFVESLDDAAMYEIWQRVLAALPQTQVINLEKMPETINGRRNPMLALDCRRADFSAHQIRLSGTYDSYFAGRHRHQRHDARRRLRRLSERGSVVFTPIVPPDRAMQALDAMLALKSTQLQQTNQIDWPAIPGRRDYVRALVERLTPTGQAMVATLDLDGAPIAYQLSFVDRNRLYSFVMSYRPDFRDFGPGRTLLLRIIEWSYAQGLDVYDMTYGDEDYKLVWGNERMAMYEVFQRRGLLAFVSPVQIARWRSAAATRYPNAYARVRSFYRNLVRRQAA